MEHTEIVYWTSQLLADKNKNDPVRLKVKHFKRQLNWYAKVALQNKPVRKWTVFEAADALIAISTYHLYKNSVVNAKMLLMMQIFQEKRITVIERKKRTFATLIREWMRERTRGQPRLASRQVAAHVPLEMRHQILRLLWTSRPYRECDWHNQEAALLFLAITSSAGQRLGDFAHCRWSDYSVEALPDQTREALIIRPSTDKVNPKGVNTRQTKPIVALAQPDKYICPVYAFLKMKQRMNNDTFG